MHVERMEQIIRVLENVESKGQNFNLGCWKILDPQCGTCACAIGWAAEDEWHNKQGFFNEAVYMPSVHNQNINLVPYVPMYVNELEGTRYAGFDAVAQYLDISVSEARWLFLSESYGIFERGSIRGVSEITPLEVIRQIQEFMAQKQGEVQDSTCEVQDSAGGPQASTPEPQKIIPVKNIFVLEQA